MRPDTEGRALVALLAAALAAPAAAVPPDAPLGLVTPGPLRALFLDMPLADARGASSTSVDLRWTMVNSWSIPTALVRGGDAALVQLDAQLETLQLAVAVPWRSLAGGALARRFTTTVEARALLLWGGWSDGAIEGWHRIVSTTNFARQHWPPDAVGLTLAQKGGPTLVELRSGRLALGDVALRTALRVAGAGPDEAPARWTLALRLDLKLPTGRLGRLAGSEGVDAGLGAAATLQANRWLTAHALASLRAVSGLPGGIALQPRRLQGGLDLSLVARLGPVAVLLEDRVSTPLLEGGWRLAASQDAPAATAWYALFKPHNQFSVGLRWRELTAFLAEDFTPGARMAADSGPRWFYNSNAPDVVLGIAWARSL